MKRIPIIISMCIYVYSGLAQTTSGKVLINASGDFSFSSDKLTAMADGTPDQDLVKQTTISFEPKFAYFLYEGIGVGLSTQISRSKQDDLSGNEFSQNILMVGPYIRLLLNGELFKPYLEASLGFGSSKFTQENAAFSSSDKDKMTGYTIGLGGAYFLADLVSFDFGISYNSSTIDFGDDIGALPGAKNKLAGLGAQLGFSIYLGKGEGD